MAEINEIDERTAEQNEIAAEMAINGGAIYGATGIGKTRILVKAIEYIRENYPEYKCVWAVPTEQLRDNDTPSDIKKWKTSPKFQVDLVCYKSLCDYAGGDILVLDELHHITENNMVGYLKKPPKIIIGGTATEPTNTEKKDLLKTLNIKPVRRISLQQARDKNYVQDFNIFICKIPLDAQVKYIKGYKYQGFVSEEQRYKDINQLIGRIQSQQGSVPFMMRINRKRFVAGVKTKELFAKRIIAKWIQEEKRFLIFATSIPQAETLSKHFYHSKTDTEHLEKFQQGKINHLACVQALDEGVNLYNIDCLLIISTDKEIRRLLQKIGRGIRLRPGVPACTVSIVISKDTIEDKWLEENINSKHFDSNKIHIKDYEQSITMLINK